MQTTPDSKAARTFRLPRSLLRELTEVARADCRSANTAVEYAIRKYVAETKAAKEAPCS